MANSIVVDLDVAENAYKYFHSHWKSVENHKGFQFDPQRSVTENLDELAFFALDNTLSVLYSFNDIFLDLVGRWIENRDMFELRYQESHQQKRSVVGSIVLYSLSKLIKVTDCLSMIEYFLDNTPILAYLESANYKIDKQELETVLLALYRLSEYRQFRDHIKPQIMYEILQLGPEYNVCKYLAVLILSVYLESSEKGTKQMIKQYTTRDLMGLYEGDEIDYKYLHIIEAKRLANYHNLIKPQGGAPGSTLIIDPLQLSHHVTCVYGVLIANFHKPIIAPDMVTTANAVEVLRNLALNIRKNQPTLMYGEAGAGKTFLFNQIAKITSNEVIKIHLGEQTDAKILLGTYASGERPGTFKWRPGVLTTAVKDGKWVLIEDIDKAPTEVLSILLTLLEKRQLLLPSRGEVIRAHNNFQIVSTIRIVESVPDLIGLRLWNLLEVKVPDQKELITILNTRFPLLRNMVQKFLLCYHRIAEIYSTTNFVSLNKGNHPRVVSTRDLMKFCSRCNNILVTNGITDANTLLETTIYEQFFQEAVDCFGSSLTHANALVPLTSVIGEELEIPPSRITLYLNKHVPQFVNEDTSLKIGRAVLHKSLLNIKQSVPFAKTMQSLRLMEQIAVSVQMTEPVLLVGETGTGKTTVVQQMAKLMNKKITVINVSQQTESGDLLGGYKPVTARTMAIPLQDEFDDIFLTTFSQKKNEKFAKLLNSVFTKNQWKNVVKLWKEAIKMLKALLQEEDEHNPKKKRKLDIPRKQMLLRQWLDFEAKVTEFEIYAVNLENSFVFNFVEGSLVHAIRHGDWVLLDEINLASSDTLESIADLLVEDSRSILLSEKGDIEPIQAHRDFRIFGCMNPSTDVGKRDLPLSIRSRFSEVYVHSPDRNINDLLMIIDKYIGRFAVADEWVGQDIAELYLQAKDLAEANQIVDGANQKPHFSVRTLTRTLIYVVDIVGIYGLRRSLYEGFCMSFLTLLDIKSENLLKPIIEKYTIAKLKNMKSVMKQLPPCPKTGGPYVQFKHYWMKQGPNEPIPQPHYIITPLVEKNMLNLVRATTSSRFPVLIQGPTSAGKTSMIEYLANITGHKFVRINNHEHTDLQEYLGTYVSDSSGKMVFKEGVLVEAIRNGYWIVLDELNLAPTDILEALNRLLDDNRELFIPETQQVVHPHADFMLFATQNPPGLYGGRKILSRAFRNRFLELHFDDIPQDELEIILKERCKIAPSFGKRIVEVYKQLTVQRQSTRLFEQKNSFATLRDLFRWALRDAVGYEELAANGYMLLGERVRKKDEKLIVKDVIEKVMKVKLDMDAYYEKLENKLLLNNTSVVWTKAMRRLAVLVSTAIKYNEPLLLVGETGCGKTTVCQIVAEFNKQQLITVNAHQNTETSDILGAQRPVRNRYELRNRLYRNLVQYFSDLDVSTWSLDQLVAKYEDENNLGVTRELPGATRENSEMPDLVSAIAHDKRQYKVLFEWTDGPLVNAMKHGDLFLLDEISLADDSVLERLNSVLEPERSLLLAEKGTDSLIIGAERFQFLATMNPGGDYGKKELSPALRNRFTEIWVPSMDDFEDVRQIVDNRIHAKQIGSVIVDFAKFYGDTLGGSSSGVLSLRDILAWVEFINVSNLDPEIALLHGAAMVFIDGLGTNNTAYLADDIDSLQQLKTQFVDKLGQLVGTDLSNYYASEPLVKLTTGTVQIGEFVVPRLSLATDTFVLDAPTTAANAMRVVRAMQVRKPILIEGSPGVGKTSLVSALAKATGNKLVRINLSEQTDLIDLFGSDSPAEGGNTGEFVWRDAPFLRAMKNGEWVLLDEMNLASQSVLEGLNACLDHRGEAYIPELDKRFPCHGEFKVFAAQNPQYQGGGRKGLPKSFVNRFTVVYAETLKHDDLLMISRHLYPKIDKDINVHVIEFMSCLEQELTNKTWGTVGGPWEFNLRDTLRWLQLYSEKGLHQQPSDFFNMVICHRFRIQADRDRVMDMFRERVGPIIPRDKYLHVTDDYLQAGLSLVNRRPLVHHKNDTTAIGLHANYEVLEYAVGAINHNIPLILTGPSQAGKTDLVRYLANCVGAQLDEFAMNNDVDSMDILGGYEQVDITRRGGDVVRKLRLVLQELILVNLQNNSDVELLGQLLKLYETLNGDIITIYNGFKMFINTFDNAELALLYKELDQIVHTTDSVRFEWFDGLVVQAVEQGHWLILDNANLCNPSVLDRLNSLLEVNGTLIINECSNEDGLPRVLKPHPNFRLFLTVDPKYGELSRAMRNRGIEVYMDELSTRTSDFDQQCLHHKTTTSFTSTRFSSDKRLAELDDICSSDLDVAIVMGTIPFNIINEFEHYMETIQQCRVFGNKQYSVETYEYLKMATEKGIVDKLAKQQENKYVAWHYQAMNPLINTYVTPASKQYNYLFQAIGGMRQLQSQLERINKRALGGNINELTYVERTAAYNLGRNIKPPNLDIYTLMVSVCKFMNESEVDFEFLVDLQIICQGFLSVSQVQNESKFRAFKDLIAEWVEIHEIKDTSLNNALESFSGSLHLTSGYLMEKIWDKFRVAYPNSKSNWLKLYKVIDVFEQFDLVARAQDLGSIDEVYLLQQSLLDLYDSVVNGKVSHDEFEPIIADLNRGITHLNDITKSFAIERNNEFQSEFDILGLMCLLHDKPTEVWCLGSIKTLDLVKTPYLSIFGTVCRFNGTYESRVVDLFNSRLCRLMVTKSINFPETSGMYLQTKLRDTRYLIKQVINNSQNVLADPVQKLSHTLRQWIHDIVGLVYKDNEIPNDKDPVNECFNTFFVPALDILKVARTKKDLGLAYVLFAQGALQLYVPSSSLDPAIKEHVVYENFFNHQKSMNLLMQSLVGVSKVLGGHKIVDIMEFTDPDPPHKPQVFRETSVDGVYEEWKAFMDSVKSLDTLVKHIQDLNQQAQQLLAIFQNNSSRFIHRLNTNFREFSDLNDILKGYVYAGKIGLDLMTIEDQPELMVVSNAMEITNHVSISRVFEIVASYLKVHSESVYEQSMVYFMKLGFSHRLPSIINQSLQTLYYRWSHRKLQEAEEFRQNESLYKYADADIDIDDDFKQLFPDYQDIGDVVINKGSNDEIYYHVTWTYMEGFENREWEVSELVLDGSHILAGIGDYGVDGGTNTASNLVTSLYNLSAATKKFVTEAAIDFYHDLSPQETQRAIDLIHNIIQSTTKLLMEWPEHSTLRDIVRVSKEFLEYPLHVPISRQLQKIEQIYTFMAEWEKYAHSKVSLKAHFDQLTLLIVSWRRLELSTWQQLFEYEDRAVKLRLGKWWFHLFESIIVPLYDNSANVGNLVSVLMVFLKQATFGEFSHRLRLLKAFKQHVYEIQGSGDVYNAISNVVIFYQQFQNSVNEKINVERKKLEKDINEVILLASWKDVNIDALKQSARKSHTSLYKIIRKYRALLSTSVIDTIDQGLISDTFKVSILLPKVVGSIIDADVGAICARVSTWNSRPQRLQDITVVDKNMATYLGQISSQEIPSFYEYAKRINDQADSLKQETPTTYKPETKKLIAALKNQKAKLFSNTLKELRNMGLKNSSTSEVKGIQVSVAQLLVNSTTFQGFLEGYDDYYFKILELLPRLKESLSHPTEDIAQPSLEKGFAVMENMIYYFVKLRNPLLQLSSSVKDVKGCIDVLETFSQTEKLLPASVFGSCQQNVSTINDIIKWLPKLIGFVAKTVEEACGTEILMRIFYSINRQIGAFESRTDTVSYIGRFNEFLEQTRNRLNEWNQVNPAYSFAGEMILNWLDMKNINLFINSTSLSKLNNVEDVEMLLREVSNTIIIVYQKIVELQEDIDDDNWFEIVQKRLSNYIKASHHMTVVAKLQNIIHTIETIEHTHETSQIINALTSFTLPLLHNYFNLITWILDTGRNNYYDTCHGGYILAKMLYSLSSKGYCSPEPPAEEKADDTLQEGTGLGDGEGAQNAQADEEDVDEDALTENKEKDKDDDSEEGDDNAVDMEGDMAGDVEEVSDQEGENEDQDDEKEMDEEVDDIDDLDPNAVDEKMWDEEAKENKEKESDKVPDNGDDMVANDNEGNENDKEKDDDNEGEEEDDQKGDEGDDKDVGEQEDDVRNDDQEKMEDVEETEALELPNDMNLDMDEEGDDEEKEDEDDIGEGLDTDIKEDEMEVDTQDNQEGEPQEDVQDESQEELQGNEEEIGEDEGNAEVSEDEELNDNETGETGEKEDETQPNEALNEAGVDGADNDNSEIDMKSAMTQETGEQGEGADNKETEANQNLGSTGGASAERAEDEPTEDNHEKAKESLKELGDALKEFHRRHQEIQDATNDPESQENGGERPDEFQHVDGSNSNDDTQALGAADTEQIQTIDEDQAIEDEPEIKQEPEVEDNDVDVDMDDENVDIDETDKSQAMDFDAKSRIVMGNQPKVELESGTVVKKELNDVDDINVEEVKVNELDLAAMSLSEARELWKASEVAVNELASGLCEQLRLILEPTLATKLKGDYKTGKRLNMKRIIPYIASDFRKDKIWLRRTKPSKRQYQIMIAVDDSKSMSESKSTELAFNSIALVCKALTQLESGGLSVVRFGEDVKVVHPFDKPFNQDTGAKVFQYFDFQQTRTDIKSLCMKSLSIFENAKLNANNDLWQLQIILSDGVCEDHETIQALVRRARESRIMLVFVIIDGINSNESILDMAQVRYVDDVLKVDKYLDSFPFEFYVVVKDIHELPEMLSLILRQYFSEMVSV